MKKEQLFKSILDQDRAPVVVCDMASVVVYMNPAAIARYGCDLTGKSIKCCHPAAANERIDQVLAWFGKSRENNIVFTYHNDGENKDVYMVALRDGDGGLIGYYEKHEFRGKEEGAPYSACAPEGV